MNKHAKKWVEVLRSGEYKQTTNTLRDQEGFCCLGVACDLYQKSHPTESKWFIDRGGDYRFLSSPNSYSEKAILPNEVESWLGLRNNTGLIANELELSVMNDKGFTFDKIAEAIEKFQEDLFVPN